jgi:2-polyprenyl-3-methyl-5-hydroxy-6-metoxy-1,4-benzoquinol methylase
MTVAREVREQQYRSGGWDYLAGDDEAAHYQAIAQFYARHLAGGSLLDIGCGAGILLAYLARAGMDPARYTGVDLAQEAVDKAASSFPRARFSRLDYSTVPAPGTYDGVVFNETLYFFDDPPAMVNKAIAENMHPHSLLIVSMYGGHHDSLWDALAARCAIVDDQTVENRAAVCWTIRAFVAKPL